MFWMETSETPVKDKSFYYVTNNDISTRARALQLTQV